MDDLSDTNWIAQVTSIKSFLAVILHSHRVTKAVHNFVWVAVPLFWAVATDGSKGTGRRFGSSQAGNVPISFVVRACCILLAALCWIVSRPGVPIFLVSYLVLLALTWAILLFALVLNAVMLLPFAAGLIIGLAAGHYMDTHWWVTVSFVVVGTALQYLQHRRSDRKRQTELGVVLTIASGQSSPSPHKPERLKTHAEIREERAVANAAKPVFPDHDETWLHLIKTAPGMPPKLQDYPDSLLDTAKYVTDHEIYWERSEPAKVSARQQGISTVRYAVNQLAVETGLPYDAVARLRSKAKWLTIDDVQYDGQRRPLYPEGWQACDGDAAGRLYQLGTMLEEWNVTR